MSTALDAPRADSKFYRVVHRPRIAVRNKPSTDGEVVHVFQAKAVFLVQSLLEEGWVQLADEEMWVHNIYQHAEAAYVLIDGKALGLGQLIEPVPESEIALDSWTFAAALRRAAAMGVPFDMSKRRLLPVRHAQLDVKWLSDWHQPETPLPAPVKWKAQQPLRGRHASRLCVALLVRGIAASPLVSFVRYHHAIGFQRVVIFFDKPEDLTEVEAISEIQSYSSSISKSAAELQVHLCTAKWWEDEKMQSRFYKRTERDAKIYSETVELHEETHDVQARQILVIDRAVRDAHQDGFDWLLHIDSDELLLLPQERDARAFFDSVPSDCHQVVFYNFEALPEQLENESGDWFQDVSLFKVHHRMFHDSTDLSQVDMSEKSKRREERMARWRAKKIARGHDPDDLVENKAFDHLMFTIRLLRREYASSLNLSLPPQAEDPDELSESDEDENSTRKFTGWTRDVPTFFNAYGNGKAACRLLRDSPPPIPVGVHRFASDTNTKLQTFKSSGLGAAVVLHYANCGYGAWRQKYELLCKGHGTEDGAFSVTRGGISSLRAHLAGRELTLRGNEADLEGFYRTFIMGNEYGELPWFSMHGLIARVSSVRELINAQAEREGRRSPAD